MENSPHFIVKISSKNGSLSLSQMRAFRYPALRPRLAQSSRVIDSEAQLQDLVDQTHFEGEILVLGVPQAETLSLVLAPSEHLAVGVDGGLDVDSSMNRGYPDVRAELVSTKEGVGNLHRSSAKLEGRPFSEDTESPHKNVAFLCKENLLFTHLGQN